MIFSINTSHFGFNIYFMRFGSGSMGKVLATRSDQSSIPKSLVKDMHIYNTSPMWWQDRGESLGPLLTWFQDQ